MSGSLSKAQFNQQLLNFLEKSPTPFHAVSSSVDVLEDAGFQQLEEDQKWALKAGGKYYVIRNHSSIIAFTLADNFEATTPFNMVGAHTDSPCLKVKPEPEIASKNYFQLGVEVYGGALLNPWFDRDLSLAGRVSYLTRQQKIKSALIDFKSPIAIIPSLAIHLDRNANENRTINKQQHLPPILSVCDDKEKDSFHNLLISQIEKSSENHEIEKVLDHELFFYDTQSPAFIGLKDSFIASARLDNLLSCYIALQSMVSVNDQPGSNLIVFSDHEEVGSASSSGAQGPFLKSVLKRIYVSSESFARAMHQSLMISADNAHGVHPNYADKHDDNHGPILNAGPVIKINANQRYATNSETSAMFKHFCDMCDVPYQNFVVRSDMGCGSTIGPITATELGVKTVDIGLPTFGMHSIRELAGVDDGFSLYQVFNYYFSHRN